MTDQKGLRGLLIRTKSFLTNPDDIAIRLVFVAGVITILHKSGLPVPAYATAFGVCLGMAALLYEMNAAKAALQSFWHGRFVGLVGWSFVWLAAFAYSMNQWIGAASENEAGKSNMHKAAFVATANSADELKLAKAELTRLEEQLRMVPVRTAEQAQVAIDAAKAHRFWDRTNGCTKIGGKETQAFCDGYASAVADKAGAGNALVLREEHKQARARLEKAQFTAAATPVETSEARNDLVILTKYAGMTEGDARTFTALGSILAISIFLSVATALKELEELRKKTRVPMFNGLFRRLFAAIRRLWDGSKSGTVEIVRDRHIMAHTIRTPNGKQIIGQEVQAA